METKIENYIDENTKMEKYNYSIDEVSNVGKEISQVKYLIIERKKKLDSINSADKEKLLSNFNYFRTFRNEKLSQMFSRYEIQRMVNNSWLKGMEILAKYKIFERYETICAFDTSALPGFYLFAMSYYANYIARKPFEWYGACDSKIQKDDFRLYRKNTKNYVLNGSILNEKNINTVCDSLNSKNVNFIMADHEIDTSNHYNDQENFFTPYVISQMLMIIRSLRKGGSTCIKQYSFFEPFTICYIYAFSALFEEFYIYKPITSKKQNSEIYLVGIGYKYLGGQCQNNEECCSKNNCADMRRVYKILKDSLNRRDFRPFISEDEIRPFCEWIKESILDLGAQQISALDDICTTLSNTSLTKDEGIRKRLVDEYTELSLIDRNNEWEKYMNLFEPHKFNIRIEKFI